jgi:hypothetical protein
MRKPVTFASSFRIKSVPCRSGAVLLSACGGLADESVYQQLLAGRVASENTAAPSAMATAGADARQAKQLPTS